MYIYIYDEEDVPEEVYMRECFTKRNCRYDNGKRDIILYDIYMIDMIR